MRKLRVIIMISGRGSNMEAIVRNTQQGILSDCCEVVLVFANSLAAKGLESAQSMGIPTLCIESNKITRTEFERLVLAVFKPFNADYIILAGFNRILTSLFIDAYRQRIINIHPADTNLYQGLHGYEWAWSNRMESTTVTVHFVDKGVDTGPIIAQCSVDLTDAHSLTEVEQRGLTVEHTFYSQVLRSIFSLNQSGSPLVPLVP